MSKNPEYDLITNSDQHSVIVQTDLNGVHCASCMWDEEESDVIHIKTEHVTSLLSQADALDQLRKWAEDKFGPCKIVPRAG